MTRAEAFSIVATDLAVFAEFSGEVTEATSFSDLMWSGCGSAKFFMNLHHRGVIPGYVRKIFVVIPGTTIGQFFDQLEFESSTSPEDNQRGRRENVYYGNN